MQEFDLSAGTKEDRDAPPGKRPDLRTCAQLIEMRLLDDQARPLGYVQGKTRMRELLVHEYRLSQLRAEEVIDTLELQGWISFVHPSEPARPGRWIVRTAE